MDLSYPSPQPLNDSSPFVPPSDDNDILRQRSWKFKNSELDRDVDVGVKEAPPAPPLSIGTRLAYGAPNFSMTSLTMLIGIHGTMFYIAIGADVAFLAFFIAIARSFDVLTDPVMGYISDVTESVPWRRQLSEWKIMSKIGPYLPSGRRRPYMALFAMGYSVTLTLLFAPPTSLSPTGISIWFGIFYIIFYLFDTTANVPWSALAPELSDSPKERDGLFFVSNLFKGLGVLCGATLPAVFTILFKESADNPLSSSAVTPTLQAVCPRTVDHIFRGCSDEEHLNGSVSSLVEPELSESHEIDAKKKAMMLVAIIFAVYYLISMYICVWKLRERVDTSAIPSPPIVPAMLTTMRNKPFMMILPAWILDTTAITMLGTMLPFFTEYVVMPQSVPQCDHVCCGNDCRSKALCETTAWLAIGLVALMGANVVSMPFWLAATRRFGKRRAWLSFNLLTCITDALFVFVGTGDPKLCVALAFLNGLPSGGQFLTESIVADIIDYDELLTGLRSEGRFTIFQTFLPKLVSVPAQTIPLALLTAVGFVPPCKDGSPFHPQPERVGLFIKVVFFVIPTLCAFGSFLIKRRFPISEEMVETIRLGCAKHMKGEAAWDPVSQTTRTLPWYARDVTVLQTAIWRLDHFSTKQLETIRPDCAQGDYGRRALVTSLQRLTYGCLLTAVVFLSFTVASLPLGLLTEPSTSWAPSFSVILGGMSFVAFLFNRKRLSAARELLEIPDVWNRVREVIGDVINDRRGGDHRSPQTLPSWGEVELDSVVPVDSGSGPLLGPNDRRPGGLFKPPSVSSRSSFVQITPHTSVHSAHQLPSPSSSPHPPGTMNIITVTPSPAPPGYTTPPANPRMVRVSASTIHSI